jgi:dTDP-4-dehydrorhamnose 3,5-epimerase
MLFTQTELQDSFIVEPERLQDERGFFARTWCEQEFGDRGLDTNLVQCSISFNKKKGTLRGMHLQIPPSAETKLVRCTQGAIYDVIVDLRSHSSTYMQWIAVDLTAENRKALYIPKGFAHGFQTLEDNTEIFYQMSDFYRPDFARGFRWNDPNFKIYWPELVTIMSERDREYEDFVPGCL